LKHHGLTGKRVPKRKENVEGAERWGEEGSFRWANTREAGEILGLDEP